MILSIYYRCHIAFHYSGKQINSVPCPFRITGLDLAFLIPSIFLFSSTPSLISSHIPYSFLCQFLSLPLFPPQLPSLSLSLALLSSYSRMNSLLSLWHRLIGEISNRNIIQAVTPQGVWRSQVSYYMVELGYDNINKGLNGFIFLSQITFHMLSWSNTY